MSTRRSDQDTDGITWHAAGLRLGAAGMDLRRPAEPGTFSDLTNARFVDERTTGRRDGHLGRGLRDGADFPDVGSQSAGEWIYGHGHQLVFGVGTGARERHHYPIHLRGAATFRLGTDVVWTGDRLLIPREGGHPALGASEFWWRGDPDEAPSGTRFPWGIPAYLPVMTDSTPPSDLGRKLVETCLTSTLRVYASIDNEGIYSTGGPLVLHVLDRETGSLIDRTVVTAAGNAMAVKLVASGETPLCVIIDENNDISYSSWTGIAWTPIEVHDTNVRLMDVSLTSGGALVAWATFADGEIRVCQFLAGEPVDLNHTTGHILPTTHAADLTDGHMSMAVGPDGVIGVVWRSAANGVRIGLWTQAGVSIVEDELSADPLDGNTLSLTARRLKGSGGSTLWVAHLGNENARRVDTYTYHSQEGPGLANSRWNTEIASKGFLVGDEVFIWLRSRNAGTLFLLPGTAALPPVAAYADREEAPVRRAVYNEADFTEAYCPTPLVTPDPLDPHVYTWVRPYDNGDQPTGGTRAGDIDFLPTLSVAAFGRSVYLSGSAVKNWDGERLSDAGFHDYPVIVGTPVGATNGALTALGVYYFRVYPVRYNAKGERFQGAALTSDAVTLVGGENSIGFYIRTLPSVSTDDVVFEIYRTEAGGTTFYLDDTIANDFAAVGGVIAYESVQSDASLRTQLADPHSTGVGNPAELEEFGPLGCSILVSARDRLWGAGGQVPPGVVQFSKLKEAGEGAGFDALAGYQDIDTEARPITSIAAFNDATIIFQRDRVNVLGGPGPNNLGGGGFDVPQLVLAGGAVTHAGTALTQEGIAYWGAEGPLLLTNGYQVLNIAAPVRPLTSTMTPSAVRVDVSAQEVVWYTSGGGAMLWSYSAGSRWARWTGVPVAGVGDELLVTPSGRLLEPSPDAYGDDGVPFEFGGTTGALRPADLFSGSNVLGSVGLAGAYEGAHDLRFRLYYNGSPAWREQWIWDPNADNGGLVAGTSLADLTAAEIDALPNRDRSGQYVVHRRVDRQNFHHFAVRFSDIASLRPTYTPYELSFEMGVKPRLGRIARQTFNAPVVAVASSER